MILTLLSFARAFAPIMSAVILVLGSACSAGERGPVIGGLEISPFRLEQLFMIDENAVGPDRLPLLDRPTYMRFDPDSGILWILDNGRKGIIALDREGDWVGVVGRGGRGPGEIRLALAFDVAPDGSLWVADAGNGKIVGFARDAVIGEFLLTHAPMGLAAMADEIWVGGDLMNTVLKRYDREGHLIADVGVPMELGATSYRKNQGMAVRGSKACSLVWVYAYRSLLECYDASGHLRWRQSGPVPVIQGEDWHPFEMGSSDRYSYVDVAASNGMIFALFHGGLPTRANGVSTPIVHMFSEESGEFIGARVLPRAVNFIARSGSYLLTLSTTEGPTLTAYRVLQDE